MKLFLRIFLFILLMGSPYCFGEELSLIVIPDDLEKPQGNYYVFPEASEVFSTDIINNLNKSGKFKTPPISKVKHSLTSDPYIKASAVELMREYKYTYNIDFDNLQKVAKKMNSHYFLLITSSIDSQNYILRRTLWDFLNIPGATVIDPAYKLSTYVALIDTDKEIILWQKKYSKRISTIENRIVAVNFAPATEQLEKIKFYSEYLLAPEIAQMVKFRLLPSAVINSNASTSVEGEVIETQPVSDFPSGVKSLQTPAASTSNDEIVTPTMISNPQAKNNFYDIDFTLDSPASNVVSGWAKELELKTKSFVPVRIKTRPRTKNIINDI